jgi:hypothetical protein
VTEDPKIAHAWGELATTLERLYLLERAGAFFSDGQVSSEPPVISRLREKASAVALDQLHRLDGNFAEGAS